MVSLTRVGPSSSTSVFTAASLPGRLRSARRGRVNLEVWRADGTSGGYGGQVYGSPAPWPATTGQRQAGQPGSISGRASPSAAACSARPGSPRTRLMITTAMQAPMTGPRTYTHQPVKSVLTISGPSERAGFIDAPLIGLANSPSSATVEPTAIAALWPIDRCPVAVLRMMLTKIVVSSASITSDRHSPPGELIG